MPVEISGPRRPSKPERERLNQLADAVLARLGQEGARVSVRFTGDAEMARLNHRYRGMDSPTNVISFCLEEGGADPVLGEIIISVDTAERESREGGTGLLRRLAELLLHGLVHLTGYNHKGVGRREWGRVESDLEPLLIEAGFV